MKKKADFFVPLVAALVFVSCQWGIQGGSGDKDAAAPDGDDTGGDVAIEDVPSDGTEPEPECVRDADCDDDNPCNGEETCGEDGTCRPGTPLPEGSDCETAGGLPGTCTGGICVPDTCGNGELDGGEDCDDGNDEGGDGCENDCTFTCRDAADCDDGNVCTDDDCVPNENGQVCEHEDNNDPCEDGLDCTTGDTCGGGECEPGDLAADTCLIDGACYDEGSVNPDNECEECRSADSTDSWSPVPDMEACADGICCDGECRVGGECCVNEDCPEGGCTGTAAPCDSITDAGDCDRQTGCSWVPSTTGVCTGTNGCGTFTDVLEDRCLDCGCEAIGCGGGLCNCRGPGDACDTFTDAAACGLCGCTWDFPMECRGTHMDCSMYFDSGDCENQIGCSWSTGDCVDYTCQ